MYQISVPVTVTDHFRKEQTLSELRRAGAQRVFLALPEFRFDKARRQRIYDRLADCIPYFKAAGFEVGVWFCTFVREDPDRDTRGCQRRILRDGTTHGSSYCPSDPGYIADCQDLLKHIAALGPDIIQFDDDYAMGNCGPATARCYCNRHMAMYQEALGEEIDRESLYEKAFSGKPNRYRDAVLQVGGQSIENFSRKMREAVDEVDPTVRISVCTVMCLWDMDGTEAVRNAQLLAGATKPIMRLIGAPYWAYDKSWGNRLSHVIEQSRMQDAWCAGADVEIMSEGDTYPRPRHRVPASHLEGYDTALRFCGATDGILKYMIDYTSSPRYETGYIDAHEKHQALYQRIHAAVEGKTPQGVRVYNAMHKYAAADLTDVGDAFQYGWDMFFSRGARLLADSSIPTTYEGTGWCSIAFGENARHLPSQALDHGLILDIRAARILMEQGVDVGIEAISGIGENRGALLEHMGGTFLYYPAQDEYTSHYYRGKAARNFVPKAGARVITVRRGEAGDVPDTILYENAAGQRFMVYGFDAQFTWEERYRNYATQAQLLEAIQWLGNGKTVSCPGNPDLYMQCTGDDRELAVGLWNFFADETNRNVVTLDGSYRDIRFLQGGGRLEGDKVVLEPIGPYGFTAFVVSK